MKGATQGTIFDEIAAREAAELGIARAAKNNPLLEIAKRKAIELGRRHIFVTADDVQKALIDAGYPEGELGNAAGSVFRNKKHWVDTNRPVKSKRVKRHGALIRVWQYIGN
jgi:hypothetical protein